MKTKLLVVGASVALAISASAVTVQLSAFGAGNQTVLGNAAGVPTNGMLWGVLVDTDGNGFGDYTGLDTSTTLQSGFFAGTDNYLFLSSNLTSNFAGSDGVASQIIFNLNADVTGNENFALIWFPGGSAGGALTPGSSFGLATATDLVVPASNSATIQPVELRGSLAGAATLVYGIPEPSTFLLGAVGVLGLLRRRR